MTVSNKPGHRGEHEGSRKTIARGMPGLLRCTCGDYARVLTSHFAREAVGALGTRHSLRPLFSLGGRSLQNSGASRRGNAKACSKLASRHCEPTGRANARPMTGSAKQSISPRKGGMDCFVTSLLAMTAW